MGEGVGTEEMSRGGREGSGGVTLWCARCQPREGCEKSGRQQGVGGSREGGRTQKDLQNRLIRAEWRRPSVQQQMCQTEGGVKEKKK